METLAFILILCAAVAFFLVGRTRAVQVASPQLSVLHSRPSYHGLYSALWVGLIGLLVLAVLVVLWPRLIDASIMGQIAQMQPGVTPIQADLALSDIKSIANGDIASKTDEMRTTLADEFASQDSVRSWVTFLGSVGLAILAGFLTLRQIAPDFRARNRSERFIRLILLACAAIAVLTTVGIVLSLIFETIGFFQSLGWRVDKFLFGATWSPLSGVHEGNIDADKVGAIPLFVGTLMITIIAMIVAVPIGLMAAIYLSDFASSGVRSWAKPMLELLAGVPTVVYGFFAAITVAPYIRGLGESIGLTVASESALAAGVVMGIMIIPFISSLSDDVINAVPQSLRDGSYGLGATKAETIRQVVLPAALPGIVSAVLLGVSRAVGETMIVVMAAGQGANLTANPLEAVTTVTVQIVALITGDTEAATAAGPAFTLGFTLFCVTLLLNVVALRIVRRYRELYD